LNPFPRAILLDGVCRDIAWGYRPGRYANERHRIARLGVEFDSWLARKRLGVPAQLMALCGCVLQDFFGRLDNQTIDPATSIKSADRRLQALWWRLVVGSQRFEPFGFDNRIPIFD
jgi:hypothetical protein